MSTDQTLQSGVNRALLNTTIKPTDDFFAHANGIWLEQNPIPADKAQWGSFYKLREDSLNALHNILEQLIKENPDHDTEAQKLRDFYATGMDMAKRNQQGSQPIKKYLDQIDSITTPTECIKVITEFHTIGIMPLWNFAIWPDEKNSSRMLPYFSQCNLGLPERDYYFRDDEKSKKLRDQYNEHIEKMFTLANFSNPSDIADRVIDIESRLAKVSKTPTEQRDVIAQYNPHTETGLAQLAPDINWSSYLRALGLPPLEICIVMQPDFFKALRTLFKDVSIEDIKDYLRWNLISDAASSLSDDFVNEHFEFYGKILHGIQKLPVLWKRCVADTDDAIGQALGKIYVEKYFGHEAKEQINELVDNLIIAYEKRIQKLDWMSPETKQKAIAKLKAIGCKLGFPDVWLDYSALEIGNDSFFENECHASAFEFKRSIDKYGKPTDRTEWLMTPSTVNAYYWPSLNEIVFPAGIMQPPFFDPNIYVAKNYGGIGSVIGHELTHGFDDQGSLYDAEGNLHEWWTPEDKEKFKTKTQAIVKQYDAYKVFDDLAVNGDLTQGENIADLGGLLIAYDALQEHFTKHGRPESVDGFKPEQLFFYGFAECESGKYRDAVLRMRVLTDPHSPSEFRVNGTVINVPAFREAFSGQPEDKLCADQPLAIW